MHQESELIYRLEGVAKHYPGRTALSPISLKVGAGEAVAVMGASGSGKTTLLHLLGGVIHPNGGRVALNGHALSELAPGRELSGMVGVIHQQLDLVPHLSVIQNVLAGRLGQWGLWRSLVSLVSPRDRHLAFQALDRVGLGGLQHERTSKLSGGEQQRVAIARLLVQDPRVIIADEPVASLDPARARDLIALLSHLARETGKTLIASLHSMELAREYFSRVIGLRNGELLFDLTVDGLTRSVERELYDLGGLEGEGVD